MPVVLKLKIGQAQRILRGHAHYWKVMRTLQAEHGEFTVSGVDLASSADRAAIRTFVHKLIAAGFVEYVGDADAVTRPNKLSPAKRYRIVRDQAEVPRLGRAYQQGTGQRSMWNVLRGPLGRDGISARDLAAYASTESVPVSLETARSYIKMLAAAGYLSSPGIAVWRLRPSMNTGPMPPMILRSRMVYDQNTDKVVGEPLAEEDRP